MWKINYVVFPCLYVFYKDIFTDDIISILWFNMTYYNFAWLSKDVQKMITIVND